MADIIGVLGQAAVATIATTVVYTVPSGKAAKVNIMWRGQAGADSLGDLDIRVNGIVVARVLNMTTVEFLHSNSTLLVNPSTAVAPTGATALLTVAPCPFNYYLNAADIIEYIITTTAMTSMQMQVVGSEVDV